MEERHTPFLIALVSGGLAGTTVDVALYPIDTLKTRLQSPQGFLKSGGFRGIYNGECFGLTLELELKQLNFYAWILVEISYDLWLSYLPILFAPKDWELLQSDQLLALHYFLVSTNIPRKQSTEVDMYQIQCMVTC